MTPPPVSETAAWTEQDERRMQWWAKDHDESRLEVRFAHEILRLRADNERLTKARDDLAKEYLLLDAERAATRKRETPPLVSPHVCDECHGEGWNEHGDPCTNCGPWADDGSTTSRSRVSDNGE